MNYCMTYDNRSRHLKDFNEVILKYTHKTSEIIEHIKNYEQEQRVILNIQELENAVDCKDILCAAAGVHSNIAIMGSITQLAAMKEIGLPYFLITVASSWDTLNGYINMGVSDVYVGNEFAFDLKTIASVCKEHNVKVRVYANVAQTDCPAVENTITQFFIRPEDITLYEPLVDVIEFYGPLDRQDVLYEIYTKQRWLGDLSDLILGLKDKVNNTLITGAFGMLRINCKKRCGYSKACNICTRYLSVDKTIHEVINNESEVDEVSV